MAFLNPLSTSHWTYSTDSSHIIHRRKCSTPDEFDPCSLCLGGEAVPSLNKEIKEIDGLSLGFLQQNQNCGAIANETPNIFDEASLECKAMRTLAQLCECKPPAENACTLCGGGGDIMNNPFEEVMFTSREINDIYPKEFRYARYISCTCDWVPVIYQLTTSRERTSKEQPILNLCRT